MLFHHENTDAVLEHLDSSRSGLTSAQVQQKRAQFGENKLKEKPKKTMMQRFLDQFKDVMILILLVAAAISFVIACVEGNPKEFLSRC